MVTPLIELEDVTKTYFNGELAVEVLHGVSLTILPGEFVAVMGASGSGKSTLMNILGCLDRPTAGRYRFRGEDVSGFGRDDLARLRREAFGFVFQSYHLIAGATAVENVEVPAVYAGLPPRARHARAHELLTGLGLGERLDHRPSQLSGGQQQRVSIARALMNGGQVILADEPTGALDSASGAEVMRLLRELAGRGHTVILITHDPDVARHAPRLIEVRDGRVVRDPGPPALYGGPAGLDALGVDLAGGAPGFDKHAPASSMPMPTGHAVVDEAPASDGGSVLAGRDATPPAGSRPAPLAAPDFSGPPPSGSPGRTAPELSAPMAPGSHGDAVASGPESPAGAAPHPTPEPHPVLAFYSAPGPRGESFAAEALEAARTAVRALRANLFRSVLTLLGIVIGVASVIAMLAIGDGAKQAVVERINAMGSDLLLVRPGGPNRRGGGVATLMPEDARAIAELPNVRAAVPEMGGSVTARFGNSDYQTQVTATSADFPAARNWPMGQGTFFSEEDVLSHASVAVLGRTAADSLFPDGADPVGAYILLDRTLFQVIGVMAVRGASPMGSDQDDVVLVPLTTGGLQLFGQRHLRTVTVAVADPAAMDATQDAVEALLTERHRTVDFQIRNMASLLDTATETQNTLTVLLGSIAAISLLVGGIGVMNIMLVSVTERTREIGIRMATGARTRNIQQQFLIEALVISAAGGLLGVALGLATAAAVEQFGLAVRYSLPPVLLAFGCAFGTGLLFGLLPARKAARLDPVVALAAE